jgi:tetratricopeptide (TPR) repeat protein
VIAYLAVSWAISQVTEIIQQAFGFPSWVLGVSVLLLAIGVVIIAATAWVQSHPLTTERAARDEVPDSWEVEPGQITESLVQGRVPHLTWARSLLGGIVTFSLLFGFAGLYVVIKNRGRSFAPTEAIASDAGVGVAVLPFSVSGGELDEWREGMVNLLSTNLDGAAGLRTINSRTVLARWDELVGHEGRVDEATSLAVAEAAGGRYALLGTAVGIGPSVRLTADIYDVDTGASLGQAQVEGSPDSVLALVDELSIEVIRAIVGSGRTELPSVNLASITTASVPALKAFMEGEAAFHRANYDGAIVAYERAVEADTTFALAYSRMGDAYGWKEYIDHPLAVQNRERALELVDHLPERRALLVRADAASGTYEAVELAEEAVRRYPDDPEAWYALGEVRYHQTGEALAGWEETDEAFARAAELDPSFAPYQRHGIDLAFSVAHSELVARRMQKYEAIAVRSDDLSRGELAMAFATGDSAARAMGPGRSRHSAGRRGPVGDERLTSAASFAAVDTGSAWALSCGAMYAAQEGRWDDHRQLLERLDARAERLLADGNTSGARFNAAQANVARSVGEWKHGRTAAGFELLEEARRGGVHWPGISGDLLMDMGDYRAAVRQYNTDWTGPLTRLKLARAHEMLGEDEKARAAYSYFVQAWSDADPELQPIVEQAKESIARLNADRPL